MVEGVVRSEFEFGGWVVSKMAAEFCIGGVHRFKNLKKTICEFDF